jgi:NADH-quinone oxidoreductase subunit J
METFVFLVAGAAALVGALGVVLARSPVHAALMLVLTLFSVAILFVAQQAEFLAAVQVIVYAGAIVVLFLFVIMLLGVDHSDDLEVEPLRGQRPTALAIGALGILELFLLARTQWATGRVGALREGQGSNVEQLARVIFTRYLFPFEVTSVLLVIAIIGAVVLARRSGTSMSSADEDAQQEPAA